MEPVGAAGAPAEWTDRLAISDLVLRFSDAVTRGDAEAVEAMWVDDGVWEESAPVELRIAGARAIRDHVASTLTVDLFVQMVHGAVVTLHGDGRASSRTTLQSFARVADVSFRNLGIYYDELVKVGGRWLFARRRLQNVYVESEPLTGDVVTPRTEIP
jgi:hypothetical protein